MRTLKEDLLLLALHDEKGSVLMPATGAISFGLAGALLLELLHQQRINLEDKRVVLISDRPTGDELLDDALVLIGASAKARKASYWVQKLVRSVKQLKKRASAMLVQEKLVREEPHRFLWLFPYTRYPVADRLAKRKLKEDLRTALLHPAKPDEQATALLCLVYACGLLNEVVEKDRRREGKERVKALLASDPIGKSVMETIRAVRAAAAAAAGGGACC